MFLSLHNSQSVAVYPNSFSVRYIYIHVHTYIHKGIYNVQHSQAKLESEVRKSEIYIYSDIKPVIAIWSLHVQSTQISLQTILQNSGKTTSVTKLL